MPITPNWLFVFRNKLVTKKKEAKPMHEEALRIRRKKFGADPPNVAIGLNNLALLFKHHVKNIPPH